jgi:hypothetical protein
MDGVPDTNAFAKGNPLQTQSNYQQLLQSQEMEVLRNCSQLHNGDVDIQPYQQPLGSMQTNGILELQEQLEAATPLVCNETSRRFENNNIQRTSLAREKLV